MRKAQLMGGVAALFIAGALAAGCAPETTTELATSGEDAESAVAETGLRPLAEWQVSPSENPDDFLDDIYGAYDDRAAEYPAKVIEMEDGTKVQRTPTPARDSTAHVKDYISWNTYRLDADNRGCQACHGDLAELVQTMGDSPHPTIDNLGIEVGVQQCIDCHETHLGGRYDSQFAGLMHTIHGSRNQMFEERNGDCWSCHYGTVGGETYNPDPTTADPEAEGTWLESGMHLWDRVKHRVLRGITTLDNESFTGDFSFDQDVVQTADELWSYNYMSGRDNQVAATRWGGNYLGLTPDPATDGVYDSWNITIGGEVERPTTMTLQQLIDEIGGETRTLVMQCANNGEGGTYVTNQEITGIPISKIAEYVGATDKAGVVQATSADGAEHHIGMEWVNEHEAYLVYEIGGKPLSYEAGYPVQMWVAGWVADEFDKQVADITFIDEEFEPLPFAFGAFSQRSGQRVGGVNAGICNLHEGQIINVGEPYTFEGYAASIAHGIEKIEYSFDHGKTWLSFDTPNNDLTKWTWWNFTWTPENVGSYCLMVRCVDDAGAVTNDPHEIMVNVQDPSEAN